MTELATTPTSSTPSNQRGFVMMLFLLAALLAAGHYRPSLAYPLPGLCLAVGFGLAGALATLLGVQARIGVRPAVMPALALTAFTALAWVRTARSGVPADGAEEVGTLIEGIPLFWLGAIIVAGLRIFAPPRDRRSPDRLTSGATALCAFFGLLALAFAIHAILEYHVIYQHQYDALVRESATIDADPITQSMLYTLQHRRVGSQFGNPNVLCGFLAMCMPMILGLAIEASGRFRSPVRVASAAAVALVLYAAWRTQSAGGWISIAFGLALALIGLTLRGRKQFATQTAATLIISLVLGPALLCHAPNATAQSLSTTKTPPSHGPFAADPVSTTENRKLKTENRKPPLPSANPLAAGGEIREHPRQMKTAMQRIDYLKSGLQMMRANILLGHGMGAYARLYTKYRILGASETQYAHSFVIQLGVETGFVGLILFGLFLALLAARFTRYWRAGTLSVGGLGIGCAVAVFLFDSLGDYTFYFREVYLDFCLLAGALCVAGDTGPALSIRGGRQARRRSDTTVAPSRSSPLLVVAALAGGTLFVAGLIAVIVSSQMALHYKRALNDKWQDAAAVDQTLASNPPDAERLRAERNDLTQEALALAEQAVRWHPSDPALLQMRARAYAEAGQPDAAIDDLTVACRLNPWSASLRSDLAVAEWARGNRDRALQLIDEAVRLHPLAYEHHLRKAQFLQALNRHDQALATAREALRVAFYQRDVSACQKYLREIEHPPAQPGR